MTMTDVYIAAGLRTPIGLVGKQFAKEQPEILGAKLINDLQNKYPVPIDQVICGNAVGTGGNIGRLMTLYSHLGESVSALTVDMQCASAGAAFALGYAKIKAGMASNLLVGGIESSSLQPESVYASADWRQGPYKVAQFSPDTNSPFAMVEGAERVAREHGFTKEYLNHWTLKSHQKASYCQEQTLLVDLILDLPGASDQGIRPRLSSKVLSKVPPILGEGHVISAANACLTHDAAAFLQLSSQPSAFKLIDVVEVAGDPQRSPLMVIKASQVLLEKHGLGMADMTAIEWNEAFAVIDGLFETHYPDLLDRYNIFGGALAYGHPYGASAAIIILHLMRALEIKNGRYGIAAIAAAGGQGFAVLLK